MPTKPVDDKPTLSMPHAVEYQPILKAIPTNERPRERLKRHGANAVSTQELLAIVLRVGSKGENVLRLSERLLLQWHGLSGLAKASVAELGRVHGIGDAKAVQIKAAREL